MKEDKGLPSHTENADKKLSQKTASNARSKKGFFVLVWILFFLALLGVMVWNQSQLETLREEVSLHSKQISNIQTKWARMKQQYLLEKKQILSLIQQKSMEHRVIQTVHPQVQNTLYWLNLAQQYLNLQNVNLAIQALQSAQSQLDALNRGEETLALKAAIEKEVQVLETIKMPQSDQIMDQLADLAVESSALSVKRGLPQPESKSERFTEQQNLSGYKKYWERFKQTMISLFSKAIVVHREPVESTEHFVPMKAYLVNQMQLLLLRAQWAVFQRQDEAYQQNMTQSIQWLNRNFVQDSTAQKMLVQLEKLKSKVIEPALPDLSRLLKQASLLELTKPVPAKREEPAENSTKNTPTSPIQTQRVLSS